MDVKEYISSGIIELYAMSALSRQEMMEVEAMAAAHPEVAYEISRTQDSLEEYAVAHARNPRPALRAEIMSAVAGSTEGKGKVIPMKAGSNRNLQWLAAACLSLLVISSIVIYSLYHRWQTAEERYASLLNEQTVLTENYNFVKNSYDKTLADLAIVRDQDARIITLQATDTSKQYLARVYWNRNSHNAFIDVVSLPVPASDKQYQLWALVGGKPVDAGVFEMDSAKGIQQVKSILQADAWAVTLEPKGGSVSPTLTQMYLLSKS